MILTRKPTTANRSLVTVR